MRRHHRYLRGQRTEGRHSRHCRADRTDRLRPNAGSCVEPTIILIVHQARTGDTDTSITVVGRCILGATTCGQ